MVKKPAAVHKRPAAVDKRPAAVKSTRLSRVLDRHFKRPAAVYVVPAAAFKSTRLTGFDCIKKFFPRHVEISVQKKVPGPGCDIFVNWEYHLPIGSGEAVQF